MTKKTRRKAKASGKGAARKSTAVKARRTDDELSELLTRLTAAVPSPQCELDHRDAWQLLTATILAAQSTDKIINTVTPELFRRWPTPADLAAAPREDVEKAVFRTGFFRNKAKAIQNCSQALVDHHGGEVPRTIEEMVKLPGVARKTANVVLGVAYGISSGIVVDTHVKRVARLLGMTDSDRPEQIERDLQEQLPEQLWIEGGHRILLHGRYLCLAKKPDCARCPLNELCSARQAEPEGSWQDRATHEASLFVYRPGSGEGS